MQDIRLLANAVAQHRTDKDLDLLIHAAIRNYAVDLLMNIANAIQPTGQAEVAIVGWLQDELFQIASQIPAAQGKSQ